MNKRIVVAMSGGVDSTTVAALLKERGAEVIGITMQLLDYRDAEGGCCSLDHVVDARRAAQGIGVPHYVVNFIDEFKQSVLSDYKEKYRSGKTPIPCVLCNKYVKFDLLLKKALELGADCLATGHYARIEQDPDTGEYTLNKSVDSAKDQTYFLYTLGQKELKHLMFPLGSLTKPEVRRIARNLGLRPADKPDSTGVCFVPGGNYREYIESDPEFRSRRGEIISEDGETLGMHGGVYGFTVGQRRGLGIATGSPMYVTRIEPSQNRVFVGGKDKIYSRGLIASDISWVSRADALSESPEQVKVKVRYSQRESDATVRMRSDTEAIFEFPEPERAVTPGQAVVMYRGDRVLGGGWIDEVIRQ